MRVCILSSFEDSLQRNTGASVRIYNLAKCLAEIGHDVNVVVPKSRSELKKVDNIKVRAFRGFFPYAALKVLKKFVNVGRPTALYFYDFLFLLRIAPIVRAADVVQIEQQSSSGLLIPFIKHFLKKPIVVDCHDVFQALRLKNTSLIRRTLETFLEKNAYKYADLLLTVSEVEKGYLVLNGFEKKEIIVVPNGVDTHYFRKLSDDKEIRKRYGLQGSRVVVFVGNLDYYPNREAIMVLSSKIAPRVLHYIKNVKFLVVGKTEERLRADGVVFTGFVENLPEVLSISDVAVVPLLQGSGTRLKILEYFSMGLPVVSTSIGVEGLDVKNGVNIFVEDDFDCFSSRVVELLEHHSLSNDLGRAARILAIASYDWQNITKKLDTALTQLCSRDV